MTIEQNLINLKSLIEIKENELKKLKEEYNSIYDAVIDKIGKAGKRSIELDNHKIILDIRKSVEINNFNEAYKFMLNNYPDKLRLDKNEIKKLMMADIKVKGAKIIEGFYLKILKK